MHKSLCCSLHVVSQQGDVSDRMVHMCSTNVCVHNAGLRVQIRRNVILVHIATDTIQPLRMEDGPQDPPAHCAPPQDLIALDDAEEQARWNQLSEVELQQEVLRYRASLQSLAQDLASAGGPANGQPLDGVHLMAPDGTLQSATGSNFILRYGVSV
jgi:hypothetical protein